MTAEQFSVEYDDMMKRVAESIGNADIVEGCLFPTLADIIKLEFLNQPPDPVKPENDFLQTGGTWQLEKHRQGKAD